jgi:dTDP-4-dehydrorhamnose 3,5-epimerase
MSRKPELMHGGVSTDERGRVSFVNEFDLAGCRRLYLVENFATGTVRAWHAHRHERKWVLAVSGAALAACVEIDDWDSPSKEQEVHRFVLDSAHPSILSIPAGLANGAMSLAPDTKLLYLSDRALDESVEDDIRYPARYWDPWELTER